MLAGCHVLALDLVRSWSFERPYMIQDAPAAVSQERSRRRPGFTLQPSMRRRSSMVIDMNILSLPPTRPASPERGNPPVIQEEEVPVKEEGDLFARKAGLGSLMKSAKQDVKVAEFDMDAFF